MTTACDSDVLIYAAHRGHPVGAPVARLFFESRAGVAGLGSLLLLAEVLPKPIDVIYPEDLPPAQG